MESFHEDWLIVRFRLYETRWEFLAALILSKSSAASFRSCFFSARNASICSWSPSSNSDKVNISYYLCEMLRFNVLVYVRSDTTVSVYQGNEVLRFAFGYVLVSIHIAAPYPNYAKDFQVFNIKKPANG